ncbi:hypothetical protein SBOR_7502 [Sclerotinia borealis F-4128]|uniref:Uncharacterized protein n=1 Tax=Sclerotinia borealis (strain F-4128) TaxID=1432307 RepID=W9C8J5_SCLBF|nr:hypothetical protein SBOR_7502 [Sclerotinia borealis F-4128]
MHFSSLIPILLVLPYTTQALIYWLHSSCYPGKPLQAPNNINTNTNGIQRWETLFDELRAVGKSAGNRLANSNHDPDFTKTFNVLFRQDNPLTNTPILKGGQAAVELEKFFLALEGMRHEADQVNADLRFYCDNDERWVQKVGDGETGWKDTENHLSTETRWCKESNGVDAITYIDYPGQNRPPVPPGTPTPNHNANRAAITICNHAFDKVDVHSDPRSNIKAR